MPESVTSIDYLTIGHITQDLTPGGPRLGGTASYASLTAQAFGLRVGVLTSAPENFALLTPLADLHLTSVSADEPTTFENVYDAGGNRHQILSGRAATLDTQAVPPAWRRASIVHLAPLVAEVSPELATFFPIALLGITPQGWMRTWNDQGEVRFRAWDDPTGVIGKAAAVVMSIEDVEHDEARINEVAAQARLLVVTRGEDGCSVHWRGEWRRFPAPRATLVDPTGSGDIFAAAYFYRLHVTRGDPYEAARFAVQIASASVTRPGLDGIPTPEEIQEAARIAS